jgi:DNA-binding winged helix-turn-helix (wHTH) protein
MTDLNKSRLRFGPYEVDLGTRELRKSGSRLKLSGQPFAILAALLEQPGQLVTREELRKRVWSDDTYVDFSHGLNAAVNKLREALCDSADNPRYIETLPRRGYRFIASVEQVATPIASTTQPSFTAPAEFTSSPAAPHGEPTWRGSLTEENWQSTVPVKRQTLVQITSLVAGVLLIALGLTGVWVHLPGSPSLEEAESRVRQARKSLKLAGEGSPSRAPSIWRVDIAHVDEPEASRRIVSLNQEAIGGPQPSPDGKKLAFQSGTTEGADIWVTNFDGTGPRQLTNTGACGVPRWSPDGHWIAFDTDGRSGHSAILIVAPETGQIREVVKDVWNNSAPSWSRDGKWIYFASNRAADGEENQVWKVALDDPRQPQQVTRRGGFSAYESIDGQTLYYAKHRYENPEIWELPLAGGTETRVSALVRPSTWANWAVTKDGILFLSEYSEKASTLEYFDFASRGVRPLGVLENASFWLSASADGKSVWYSELTNDQARQVFKAGLD